MSLIRKIILDYYIEAIKKEERTFSLETFIQANFKNWGFDYIVKVEIVGDVNGRIKLYTQDNKLVGSYAITDYTCQEVDKEKVETEEKKYWERDVRRLYFSYMKHNFKTWQRDFKKEIKLKAKKEIDIINSL